MSIRHLIVGDEELAKAAFTRGQEMQNVNSAENVREMPVPAQTMTVRSGGRTVFIHLENVEWIEAAANYIKIHAGEEQFVVREKISTIEQQLPAEKFVRIHRSLIVGLDHVNELQSCGNGEFVVVLRRMKELPLGRTYRTHVEGAMKRVAEASR
jgi:two-component system, LytTR family, response regulator